MICSVRHVSAISAETAQDVGDAMKQEKTSHLATGGVLTALAAASLCLASVVPGVELTCYALSSVCIYAAVEEQGPRGGLAVYAAAGILGVLIMPDKLGVLPYLVLFGIYPVLKKWIETIPFKVGQMLLKAAYLAVFLVVCYGLFRSLFFSQIRLPHLGKAGLIFYAVGMFALYDIILTGAAAFYQRRIKKARRNRHTAASHSDSKQQSKKPGEPGDPPDIRLS